MRENMENPCGRGRGELPENRMKARGTGDGEGHFTGRVVVAR